MPSSAKCSILKLRFVVVALIEAETDLTEKKQRIMVAYEHGHLTAEEAEEWIVLGGMVHA